jgi:hypothetical protein
MLQHEKRRQLECQRLQTLRLMLEKEQRYVEALRSELAKSDEPKVLQELAGAERRVRTLQDQLVNLTMHADREVGCSYKFCLITLLKQINTYNSRPQAIDGQTGTKNMCVRPQGS